MHKFLKMALKKAREYNYDDTLDYRHCAVLVKGGKVLSIGYNQRSTTAFMETFTDRVKGIDRNFNISMHAECAAIANIRNKVDLRGCKIYVARVLKNGTPGISRPCEICQLACANYGISKALYSIGPEEYGVMQIKIVRDKKFKDFECHDRLVSTGSVDV